MPTRRTPTTTTGHWRDQALCGQHPDPSLWDGVFPAATAQAVAICRQCPVRNPCWVEATRTDELYGARGVWAGLTAPQRAWARREAS